MQSFTGRHRQARGLGEGCLIWVTVVAILLIPTPHHTDTAASTVLSETVIYPVNMPDLIHITSGSAQKRWPEVDSMILAYWLAFRRDPFGLKQLEPNWIWAGFAKYDSGRLWKNEMEPERGKMVTAWLHSARTRPDDFWTLACFRTGSIEPKSDHTIQISCRLDLVQYYLDLCRKNRTESDAGIQIWYIRSGLILAACWL